MIRPLLKITVDIVERIDCMGVDKIEDYWSDLGKE